MARFVKNDKGFLIIEMTVNDAITRCGFGYGDELVCDDCNEEYSRLNDTLLYYIAALNMIFCKKCCNGFIANATRYKEDINYEIKRAEYYAERLGIDSPFTGE